MEYNHKKTNIITDSIRYKNHEYIETCIKLDA